MRFNPAIFVVLVSAILACGDGTGPIDTTTVGPDARDGHVLVYDEARQNVVLFGGSNATAFFGDTWVWNGQAWSQVATTGPSPRAAACAVYDSQRQRVVLYGGISAGQPLNDMWEWDGFAWARVNSGDGPALQHASLGFDRGRQRLVLLGGTADAVLGETWEWDGQQWQRKSAAVPATPRQLPAWPLLYSSAQQGLLALVANMNAGTSGNRPTELWLWNGTAWSSVATGGPGITAPAPVAMAGTDLLLLNIGPGSPQTLHRWNGQWTLVPGAVPSARYIGVMAYDAARQRLVMFGGATTAGQSLNDTWTWNGTSWTEIR